jgi:microcystin-dependent protein
MSGVYPTGETLSPVTRFVRLTVPEDMWVIAVIRSLLLQQTAEESWYPIQGVTQEQAAAAFTAIEESVIEDYQETTGMLPPGAIIAYTNYTPPAGWLVCDGTQYQRVTYPDLYAVLAPSLIVDADNFTVPDLRQRFILGAQFGFGGTAVGQYGGENHINLTIEQLAPHQHGTVGQGYFAEVVPSPGDPNAVEVVRSDSPDDFTWITGQGNDIPIIPPYHALQYIIKT